MGPGDGEPRVRRSRDRRNRTVDVVRNPREVEEGRERNDAHGSRGLPAAAEVGRTLNKNWFPVEGSSVFPFRRLLHRRGGGGGGDQMGFPLFVRVQKCLRALV